MPKMLDIRKSLKQEYSESLFDLEDITKIQTGIFTLDYLTDGGIPETRITIFWGNKSTGKTTTALRVIRSYLLANPNMRVVFFDYENALDKQWSRIFLQEVWDRVDFIIPDYGEQGVDIMAKVGVASDVGLIVVDSIAMMIPVDLTTASAIDNSVGMLARLVNKMFSKMCPIMSKAKKVGRKLTLLLINQPTYEIGKRSFQPIMKKVGGIKQELLATLDIKFYTKKYIKSGETPIKVEHAFSVEKNKVGLAKRGGEFTMYLIDYKGHKKGDIDEIKPVIEYAKRSGTLQRTNNVWTFKKEKFKSLAEIVEECYDYEFLEELKTSTLSSLYKMRLLDESKVEEDVE